MIVRKDLYDRIPKSVPKILNYKAHADAKSCLNTPPTFGIYVLLETFRWMERQGGLAAIEKRNGEKAKAIYDAIDESGGYYKGTVSDKAARSHMNVTFKLPSDELTDKFIKEASAKDMVALKGYRTVGGIRASIYNGMPVEGCQLLATHMKASSLPRTARRAQRRQRAQRREESASVLSLPSVPSPSSLCFSCPSPSSPTRTLGFPARRSSPALRCSSARAIASRCSVPTAPGKSTVLKLLAGELAADRGDVRVLGRFTVAYLQQSQQQLRRRLGARRPARTLRPPARHARRDGARSKRGWARPSRRISSATAKLQERYRIEGGYEIESRVRA
jgi:hypothetical protein